MPLRRAWDGNDPRLLSQQPGQGDLSRPGLLLLRDLAKQTLPTIIAWTKTGLPAEELREIAGVRVAHLKGNTHNTPLNLAEQSSR
jgi:hypothetical protein